MAPQYTSGNPIVKTTVLLDRNLLEEMDQFNPFRTRKEFLDHACKLYLKELRRKSIDERFFLLIPLLYKKWAAPTTQDATLPSDKSEISGKVCVFYTFL